MGQGSGFRKKGKRRSGTIRRMAIRLCAAACVGLAGFGLWLGFYAATPLPMREGGDLHILIPPKTSLAGIEKILVENGVIPPGRGFYCLARLSRLSQRLQAGEYLFTPGQTPYQILRILAAGATVRWSVTIPEGSNIYQLAEILAKGGWGERNLFLELMRDPEILARYGVRGASLEGYLFPDTYQLLRGQNPREIIGLMVERGRRVRQELGDLRDNPLGLSPHEVLTLASIVEKETAAPEERPLIAGVFMNRLRHNMRLQTDPTVIYGLADFDGNLTRKHLETSTPYNTYLINGLPPGPIANPGRASIAAVLHPAPESYLYFVSKNDGTHYFSHDLAEHNRAVLKYQKRRGS
ncbi:MAG: endolytic transglycosylase MltG [Desulfobulbaceae bacterium]|nr:endolytic transglycosylase MltG [Desulfobulbaceae bacterium]HIJ89770.1 endolytic transglycosylase MltG [Deltaproteobacteria bacterium]